MLFLEVCCTWKASSSERRSYQEKVPSSRQLHQCLLFALDCMSLNFLHAYRYVTRNRCSQREHLKKHQIFRKHQNQAFSAKTFVSIVCQSGVG